MEYTLSIMLYNLHRKRDVCNKDNFLVLFDGIKWSKNLNLISIKNVILINNLFCKTFGVGLNNILLICY